MPPEQERALRYLDEVCEGVGVGGCEDELRARLAIGQRPSALLVSRLKVRCDSAAAQTDAKTFCKRLNWYACQQGAMASKCKNQSPSSGIVDEPSCPIEDAQWLVSSIHTSVQACRQSMPGQLDLKFDALGSLSSPSMKDIAGSCVGAHLRKMKILPPPHVTGCKLTVRF